MLRLRRSEGLWSEWGQQPTIHLGPHSSCTPSLHLAVVTMWWRVPNTATSRRRYVGVQSSVDTLRWDPLALEALGNLMPLKHPWNFEAFWFLDCETWTFEALLPWKTWIPWRPLKTLKPFEFGTVKLGFWNLWTRKVWKPWNSLWEKPLKMNENPWRRSCPFGNFSPRGP